MGRTLDLGKICITLADGAWDPRTNYETLTLIYHGGDGYISRHDNIGVEPGTDDTTWYLIVRHGQIPKIRFDQEGNMYADDELVTTVFRDVVQHAIEAMANDERYAQAEEQRINAEQGRSEAEDERKLKERERQTAENSRVSSEAGRNRAESSRVEAEEARAAAERERNARFIEAIREAVQGVYKGDTGPQGKSAYQVAVDDGYEGTVSEWLESLVGPIGADGLSAYLVAVAEGFAGTVTEWLASLIGPQGVSIQSVEQTTTSSESEGENVITVTLSNGNTATFTVRNGKRGLQGIPGVANAKYKQVNSLPTASADTMGFIYLVESATSGIYDMSYTEEDDGAYSWKSLGTTAIQLSDYTPLTDFNQLDKEVGDKVQDGTTKKDLTVTGWTNAKVITVSDGSVSGLTNNQASDAVDISKYVGLTLYYMQLKVTASSPTYGMCFYNANGDAIGGETAIGGQADFGEADGSIVIPATAKTVRFTCRTAFIDDFYAYVNEPVYVYSDGLGKRVQDLEGLVEGYDDADFAISDENGNVIVRFKDGGVQTSKFDSKLLDSVIKRYKGKIISILGDSISTFGDPSATNEDGTYCYSYYPNASCRYSEDGVDSIEFDVEDTYWMKLIRKCEMILGVNDSYRGTRVSGNNNAFNSQTRINHLGGNGTPDVILVFGGTNDAGNGVTIGTFNTENPAGYTDGQIAALPVSTFADAYRTMLIRLMKTYPFAEIVVILPTFTSSYYTITNLDLYVEIIKEACDFFGVKYIDARCSGINIYNKSSFLVDGIHPNVAGMDLLFKLIYKHLIFE